MGKIIGVGNGDPICHEPDVYFSEEGSTNSVATDWKRSAFNGLAQIIVQSGKDAGEIKLTAKSDGLADTTAVINSQSHPPRPAVP